MPGTGGGFDISRFILSSREGPRSELHLYREYFVAETLCGSQESVQRKGTVQPRKSKNKTRGMSGAGCKEYKLG